METADILRYFQAERTIQIEPGQDIGEFLEQNDLLAVLKSGDADFISAGGQTTSRLKPGTPLGLLRNEPANEVGRIIAVTECELVPQTNEQIRRLIEFNPRFTDDLLGVMRDVVHDLVRLLP